MNCGGCCDRIIRLNCCCGSASPKGRPVGRYAVRSKRSSIRRDDCSTPDLGFLTGFDRISKRHPASIAADDGRRIEAAVAKDQRRPGARLLVRSRAVREDRFVAGKILKLAGNVGQRDVQRAGNVTVEIVVWRANIEDANATGFDPFFRHIDGNSRRLRGKVGLGGRRLNRGRWSRRGRRLGACGGRLGSFAARNESDQQRERNWGLSIHHAFEDNTPDD
jgi:hypothetical protein